MLEFILCGLLKSIDEFLSGDTKYRRCSLAYDFEVFVNDFSVEEVRDLLGRYEEHKKLFKCALTKKIKFS
jgi:hypothetical protein